MHTLLQPPGWKPPKGYANGVLAEGKHVAIAGQIGWNEQEEIVSDDLAEQTEQALKNIVAVLKEAGATPEHLVRLTWYVTDKQEYISKRKEIGAAYVAILGKHFPAMSLIEVKGLLEEGAKVEIEATAVV